MHTRAEDPSAVGHGGFGVMTWSRFILTVHKKDELQHEKMNASYFQPMPIITK